MQHVAIPLLTHLGQLGTQSIMPYTRCMVIVSHHTNILAKGITWTRDTLLAGSVLPGRLTTQAGEKGGSLLASCQAMATQIGQCVTTSRLHVSLFGVGPTPKHQDTTSVRERKKNVKIGQCYIIAHILPAISGVTDRQLTTHQETLPCTCPHAVVTSFVSQERVKKASPSTYNTSSTVDVTGQQNVSMTMDR